MTTRNAVIEPAGIDRSALPRFVIGSVGLVASALAARRRTVGPREDMAFRTVNELPDAWAVPIWLVMQGGTLGAVPVTAAAAWRLGRPALARHLLVSGGTAWMLAKLVKQVVGRPRPEALLASIRFRGRAASGLGYVSGHAAVAAALGMALFPTARSYARWLLVTAVPAVGLGRVYVGAHLPLDVFGGATLGVAIEALAGAVEAQWARESPDGRQRSVGA